MRRYLMFLWLVVGVLTVFAQTPYKLPSKEVVDILDAAPTPFAVMSPRNDAIMLVELLSQPPIAMVSQPFLRIGGLRIDPALNSRQRLTRFTGINIKKVSAGGTVRIELPANAKIGLPAWSHDGKKIAFANDVEDGVELWVADVATGKAHAIGGIRINDVLGVPFEWLKDNTSLLVKVIPQGRGKAPAAPKVPIGPNVEETSGKVSKTATYQDLLKTPYDEQLFAYYSLSQLSVVNSQTGDVRAIGKPGMILSASFSPDEQYLLVTSLKTPFSYRVPYFNFAQTTEVWDARGTVLKTITDLLVQDEIPTQGVRSGPRAIQWQTLQHAKLVWVEALDGGDPLKKVPNREKVMSLDAPFKSSPVEIMKIQHRYQGFEWTAKKDEVLVREFDRDRRWRTTSFVNLSKPESKKVVSDLSINDAYNDPGNPIYETKIDGESVLVQDGDWIYLRGRGASEQGDRPFIDRMNLKTLKKERLYHSDDKSVEQFVAFAGSSRIQAVTRYESKTEVPNYYILDFSSKTRKPITDFKDPAPQLTGMRKELVKYNRSDGVALSGTLYLPPNYKQGTRLPLLIWAYPLEYSDAGTAGQVRGSPNSFTFFRGPSPLFFVTQGYAVLMDATMPIVGDPETMNNTFVEQIVGAAKAAVDKLDGMGVIDPKRVLVSGHSYGAFMTANLLAHSDLFVAGIARSGAYNRTLTPFGFQTERRSFWEATDTYMKVSPFTHANKINEPILLIHGEADNNSGTFPIQSERLFQAIKGNGGTARLVLLPFESHGYSARESVLHVLAEMFEWADKYVKNKVVVGDK